MTNTHVELLPDNDGKYWIPKGYKVKVTADCKDGYKQNNYTNTISMNESRNVQLESAVDLITPYAAKNTLYYVGDTTYNGQIGSTKIDYVQPLVTIDCKHLPFYQNLTKDSFICLGVPSDNDTMYVFSNGNDWQFKGNVYNYIQMPYVKEYNNQTGMATIFHGDFGLSGTNWGIKHWTCRTIKVYCFNSSTGYQEN